MPITIQAGLPPIITMPQGRLTLTTVVPVLAATVAAAGTVFYTPFRGNTIPIYDGAVFRPVTFTELSNILANGATGNAGPAAVANDSNYDLFVSLIAGVLTLTRGPAWTSDTGRGSGAGTSQLTLTQGIYVNTVAITNGPGALLGTYVGTIRSNGTATTDFDFGSFATTGSQRALLNVWNMYNRVFFQAVVNDSGINYTYTTATIRAMRGDNGNRVSFVRGLNEDIMEATHQQQVTTAAALAAVCEIGVGRDSITTYSNKCDIATFKSQAVVAAAGSLQSSYKEQPGIGFRYIQALEKGDGTNANTFNVTANYNSLRVAGWF